MAKTRSMISVLYILQTNFLFIYIILQTNFLYIYYEPENRSQLQKVINKELKKANMWLDVNMLSLNIEKTSYFVFKTSLNSSTETVNMKSSSLPVNRAFLICQISKQSFG